MFYKILQIIKSFSEKERHLFFGTLIIFVISGILWSVDIFYQTTTPTPVSGGAYTEGIVGQPIAVNPLITSDNEADRDLTALMFASILDLAEDYKTDETNKIWTIRLKPGLKWSNGEPLTSDDVVFTLGVIQDPDTRSPLLATWQGVAIERLSEREIRLSLKNPYAFFADNLRNLRIAPQHIFDNIPPQNFRLSDYNLKPIASGPYQFVNFEKRPDGFIETYYLTANPNYTGAKPLIRNFKIKFFASRADAINAFNQRVIDGLGGLDYQNLSEFKTSRQILEIDIPRYYAIFFNPGISPSLKEKDVRVALDEAIDKDRIIQQTFNGRASKVQGPIPPTISGYDPSVYTLSGEDIDLAITDPIDDAVNRLEKAGWRLDDDGIRKKTIQKNKISLSFDIIVPTAPFLVDAVNLIKEDWKKIGVRLNPIILKPSEVISQAIKTRNYQMIIFGNILNNNPDIFSFWHSSQRFYPGLNLALFNDKTADSLLESVRQSFDENIRNQDLKKIQQIIHLNKPAIFLFSPRYFYAAPKNFGGLSQHFITTPSNRFDTINQWYLKTARIFK